MVSHSKRGRQYEKQIIKGKGGRLTINSGSVWFDKGDGQLGEFLVDAKSSLKEYRLHAKQWNNLRKQAIKKRLSAAFVIGLGKFNEIYKTHDIDVVVLDFNELPYKYRKNVVHIGDVRNKSILFGAPFLSTALKDEKILGTELLGGFKLGILSLDLFMEIFI